jgi:Calx-beta domain
MRVQRRFGLAVAAVVLFGGVVAMAPPAAAGGCTVSIADAPAVMEGNSGTVEAVFTLTRNTTGATPVDFSTADGTATAPGDYGAQSGTVDFGTTDMTTTIAIAVNGDTEIEDDEAFVVNIESACFEVDAQGQGTITNDDNIPTGYRLSALDGGVFAYGQSTYEGSANTLPLEAPIVDIDETWDRSGYWQAGADGGVFAWNAPFFGSVAGTPLAGPILGMAVRPQNDGMWLVGLDGGVFALGEAPFFGNAVDMEGAVIVDIVSTTTGEGYWLLDAGGTVIPFGDAENFGDYDARDVEAVGMAGTTDDLGYWIVNYPGKVHQFGTATDHGDIAEPESLNASVAGIERTMAGTGYWLFALDGGVFAFDAPFYGSAGSLPLVAPVVAMAGMV